MTTALKAQTRAPVELSIIVPVYNAEDYLASCLDSILGQSFSDFEVLLVDDGSTDGSSEIAERYRREDPRVRVFRVANGGVSSARNVGLLHAHGEYVQFVDADDLLEPECCRTFHQAAGQSSADLVVGAASIMDHNMRIVGRIGPAGDGVHDVDALLESLTPATKATLLHYVWNKWYRTAQIREHGVQFNGDVHVGEDFLFNCDYWETCRTVVLVDQAVYRYCRRNGGSLTQRFRVDELSRRRKMDARLFGLYGHFNLRNQRESMLSELVGSIALDSLSTVVLSDCPLSLHERIAFVRGFMDSEYADFIGRHVMSGRASAVARVEGAMMRIGNAAGLYVLMWVVARTKALRSTFSGSQA